MVWPPRALLMELLMDDLSPPVLSEPPHRRRTHPLGPWLMPTLLAPQWVLHPPRLPGSTFGSSQVEPIHGGHQPILGLAMSWSRLVTPGPCPQGGRLLYLRLPLASPSPPPTPTIPWALGLVCSRLSPLSWPSPILGPSRPPGRCWGLPTVPASPATPAELLTHPQLGATTCRAPCTQARRHGLP